MSILETRCAFRCWVASLSLLAMMFANVAHAFVISVEEKLTQISLIEGMYSPPYAHEKLMAALQLVEATHAILDHQVNLSKAGKIEYSLKKEIFRAYECIKSHGGDYSELQAIQSKLLDSPVRVMHYNVLMNLELNGYKGDPSVAIVCDYDPFYEALVTMMRDEYGRVEEVERRREMENTMANDLMRWGGQALVLFLMLLGFNKASSRFRW